jgi:hypothetical protein
MPHGSQQSVASEKHEQQILRLPGRGGKPTAQQTDIPLVHQLGAVCWRDESIIRMSEGRLQVGNRFHDRRQVRQVFVGVLARADKDHPRSSRVWPPHCSFSRDRFTESFPDQPISRVGIKAVSVDLHLGFIAFQAHDVNVRSARTAQP